MSRERVWLNGGLVEAAAATVGVQDRGFLLGDGLFETMRAYGGRVFRLDAHLARLARGCDHIGLSLPDGLADAVRATLRANELDEAAIRLTVSRGPAGPGLSLPEPVAGEPTVLVTVRPYRAEPAWYERGLSAVLAEGRLDERRATAGLKQLGYLEAILALRQARAAGCAEALFLDGAGHLAEAAASNLFLLAGDVLRTPPLSCGILPGITRAAVLELAAARGLRVREEPLQPDSLAGADEGFLTSSLRELVPLTAVTGHAVGAGRPGPVTLRLLQAYRDLARSDPEGSA